MDDELKGQVARVTEERRGRELRSAMVGEGMRSAWAFTHLVLCALLPRRELYAPVTARA
jgi:hypothetical protein